MLKALSLKKVYGHREVVKGVSIKVERGEVALIIASAHGDAPLQGRHRGL